jgi:hypothetical protein
VDGKRTNVEERTMNTVAQEDIQRVAEAISEVLTFEKITVVIGYRGEAKKTLGEEATSNPTKEKGSERSAIFGRARRERTVAVATQTRARKQIKRPDF